MTLEATSSMEKKTPTVTTLLHRNSNSSIEVAVGPIKKCCYPTGKDYCLLARNYMKSSMVYVLLCSDIELQQQKNKRQTKDKQKTNNNKYPVHRMYNQSALCVCTGVR